MRHMKYTIGAALLACLGWSGEAAARGFGVARGGGVAVGPRGGYAGGYRGGAAVGPYGGAAAGGARGGTYVGPRGGTIQAGKVGGVHAGPYGGVRAGGASGARVTTPGGRTYTSGSRGGVAVGPYGGVRAGGARGAAVGGPFGSAAAGYRGGVAVGPYGGVAAGRAVAVGHSTRYVSPVALQASAVRVRAGGVYPSFSAAWYRGYPRAWVAPRWRVAGLWVVPTWGVLAAYCAIPAQPIFYDYGGGTVIVNNIVYDGGQQVATVEQYAQQAEALANAGMAAMPPANDEWQPLGVFGLIQGDEKVAQNIFQLAINKAGIVRGNYYDAVADNTLPVFGSLDAKTQRVAWSIGEKKNIVFETGLNNLTQQQTGVLVHYGKERTQQMELVRLEQPAPG